MASLLDYFGFSLYTNWVEKQLSLLKSSKYAIEGKISTLTSMLQTKQYDFIINGLVNDKYKSKKKLYAGEVLYPELLDDESMTQDIPLDDNYAHIKATKIKYRFKKDRETWAYRNMYINIPDANDESIIGTPLHTEIDTRQIGYTSKWSGKFTYDKHGQYMAQLQGNQGSGTLYLRFIGMIGTSTKEISDSNIFYFNHEPNSFSYTILVEGLLMTTAKVKLLWKGVLEGKCQVTQEILAGKYTAIHVHVLETDPLFNTTDTIVVANIHQFTASNKYILKKGDEWIG